MALYPGLQADPVLAESFYRWKYFDLEGRDTGYPSAFVAEASQGLAGFLGCLPFRIENQTQRFPAAWLVDWHLLPEFKGLGLGAQLLTCAMSVIPTLASIGITADAQKDSLRLVFITGSVFSLIHE